MDPSFSAQRGLNALSQWLSPGRFALVLGLLMLATFSELVLGGKTLYYRDYGVLSYPVIHLQHESFWRGEWPLWNPYSNSGTPFLAQWGTLVLYPLSLIYLLLPLPWSLGVFCLAHLFLGGLGLYFLARRWTQSNLASSLAGIAFVFNGLTFSCLIWPNYAVALGWMPWVILTLERTWRRPGVMLAALVATMQLLSGVPELVLFTWVLGLSLAVHTWLREPSHRKPVLVRTFGVIGLATGLAALQLLPFFQLLQHSQRHVAFGTDKWALPLWGWGNQLVPLFHAFESTEGLFFQNGQEFFSSTYLGVGMWLLALFALWKSPDPRARWLGGLTLVAFVLAWGEAGKVYALLKSVLPVLGLARYPVKWLLLPLLTVPLLGALGWAAWERAADDQVRSLKKSWLLLGVGLLLLVGLILAWAKTHPLAYDLWPETRRNGLVRAGFLVVMTACLLGTRRLTQSMGQIVCALGFGAALWCDALLHVPWQNPTLPAQVLQQGQFRELASNLPPPRLGEGRILISRAAEDFFLHSSLPDRLKDFAGKRVVLWSNLNLIDEVPKVNGSSTLQVREQAQVQALLYEGVEEPLTGLKDFLGVTQTTSPTNVVHWTTRSTALPLVTAGQQPLLADEPATLRHLASRTFAPGAVVYLPPGTPTQVTQAVAGVHLSDQRWSQNQVSLSVDTPEKTVVVVAQSFYPGWTARVDGVPVPLWRANHAFQALEVPAGRHVVVLAFADRAFYLGKLISGLCLAGCLVAGIRGWRKQRPEPVPTEA